MAKPFRTLSKHRSTKPERSGGYTYGTPLTD